MPKKKGGSKGKSIAVVVILAIVIVGVLAWHDGAIGVTSMADINSGNVDIGTVVTVKGELIIRLGNQLTIQDENLNFVAFTWDGTIPPLNSIIVVTGRVTSFVTLGDVTSVRQAIIFR